eukprot:Transcript_8406.p1 GENE.Transcript_8406~~Transcript_8406.p1  ORF type:complete len:386 (-),score=39.29 Transcript_8406:372-1529(-)
MMARLLALIVGVECVNGGTVGIVGAGGYVGAELHAYLAAQGWSVSAFDLRPNLAHRASLPLEARNSSAITDAEFHSLDAVIYLGGLTGRATCDAVSGGVVQARNVHDPALLASRMKPTQLFLFASTSAVTEGSGDHAATEVDEVLVGALDAYARSMHDREQALSELSRTSEAPQLIGMRFGTVIGNSAGQRVDLAPMALLRSAYLTGVLQVTHGEVHRAFLTLDDLVRAVHAILSARTRAPRFAVFHLQSFAATLMRISNEIALQTRARIEAKDHPHSADIAGFSLEAVRFETLFGFTFEGTLKGAIKQLHANVPDSITAKEAHVAGGDTHTVLGKHIKTQVTEACRVLSVAACITKTCWICTSSHLPTASPGRPRKRWPRHDFR